jgi:hypothetical protein
LASQQEEEGSGSHDLWVSFAYSLADGEGIHLIAVTHSNLPAEVTASDLVKFA